MSRTRLAGLALAAVVGLGWSRSWAALGDFTYHTTIAPPELMSPAGDMMAMLTPQPTLKLNAAAPGGVGADVGMVCLMSEPNASGSETIAGPYTIDLVLTDADSGQTGTFALSPPLGLTAQVSIPVGAPAGAVTTTDLPATESQVIGSTLYTVNALASDYFMQPGPPLDKGEAGTAGGFMVHIAATAVPEPAGASALAAAVLVMLRRRRNA